MDKSHLLVFTGGVIVGCMSTIFYTILKTKKMEKENVTTTNDELLEQAEHILENSH